MPACQRLPRCCRSQAENRSRSRGSRSVRHCGVCQDRCPGAGKRPRKRRRQSRPRDAPRFEATDPLEALGVLRVFGQREQACVESQGHGCGFQAGHSGLRDDGAGQYRLQPESVTTPWYRDSILSSFPLTPVLQAPFSAYVFTSDNMRIRSATAALWIISQPPGLTGKFAAPGNAQSYIPASALDERKDVARRRGTRAAGRRQVYVVGRVEHRPAGVGAAEVDVKHQRLPARRDLAPHAFYGERDLLGKEITHKADHQRRPAPSHVRRDSETTRCRQ